MAPECTVAPAAGERLAVREIKPARNAIPDERVHNLGCEQILLVDRVRLLDQLHRLCLDECVQPGLARSARCDLAVGGELEGVLR